MNTLLKKLHRQKEYYLFLGSCLLSAVMMSVTFFVYIPQLNTEKGEIETMLAEAKDKIREAEDYRQAHADYKAYESDIMKKEKFLEEKMPKKLMPAKFMEEVQLMATKEQIEIVKLEPGAVSAYDDYSSQRVDMNVHGNFFQLMYFLKDMENSRMFIHVEKVSISNKKEGLDCRLGVRIFSEAS